MFQQTLLENLRLEKLHHPNTKLKKSYKNYLHSMDFKYFITVTFKYNMKLSAAKSYLNELLHLINSAYFGKNYKIHGMFLKGVVSYEYHDSSSVHFHILLEDDECFVRKQKSIQQIFKDKLIKVKNSYEARVFTYQSIHIKKVYSTFIDDYVLKEGYFSDYSNISHLSKDGVFYV